jgi:hypothetical protein
MQYQVNLTYRCNLKCGDCLQFIDVLPWPDSDISLWQIRLGGRILVHHGIRVDYVRVSGGEPTVHPQFDECLSELLSGWTDSILVCTNAIKPIVRRRSVKYRKAPPGWRKRRRHQPCMVSPKDLGLRPVMGYNRPCGVTRRCGVLYDRHGFAPCGNAGCIGRVIGVDPYRKRPVMLGTKELCEHCVFSLPPVVKYRVWADVRSGVIEYPTETWRRGVERSEREPVVFHTIEERV